MKKIYSLVLVGVLGITTMFGQGFGASLDYAMWNGAMTDTSENASSIIIGVSYSYNLSEKMDLVGSVGYGIGFAILPIKADLKYSITNKLSANLGMGMYMISDEVYDANAIGVKEEGSTEAVEGSTNEFGINLGLGYQITSALSLGFNYNMIKSGDYDFNGMQFGLAYSFGGKSSDNEETKESK
ncbi:MAG: outer membrane beta-barrel protein [Bacteroidetes bacterium]|nr:outer membrane beta-barrel protein [Bacteroidota bacterium]